LTIIGAYDGRRPHIFVKDINLSDAANVLSKHPILVSFNGTLFDLPFIRKELPDLRLNHVHIDLRFLLRTIGLSGGLKKIELKLGIPRAPELESVEGRQAAVLWREFLRRNNDDAIRKLVLYNLADTINLRVLMEYCYIRKLQQKVLPKFSRSMFNRKIGTLPKINGATLRSSWLEPSSQGLKMRSNRRYVSLSFKREKLVRIDRTELRWRPFGVYGLIQQIKSYGKTPRAVGIDLSGSEARPTGISILDERRCELDLVHTDKEIIEKTLAANPSVVSIDSPLSLPEGRDCVSDECSCRRFGITREIERTLKRRGVNIYPCLIKSMQKLTERGMMLSETLSKRGQFVIESYPGAAQDILGFPRKRINLDNLRVDLLNTGIIPSTETENVSHHEIDALTSALVGFFFLAGKFEAVGSNNQEGYLIIPDLSDYGEQNKKAPDLTNTVEDSGRAREYLTTSFSGALLA